MSLAPTIAYFITSHGFGHASRAGAVMNALTEKIPGVRFELFTTCPQWIFQDTLKRSFGYHTVCTDIGMVQLSPLKEDALETRRQLDRWLPLDESVLNDLAGRLQALKCNLVVCDISILGLAAAHRAGLSSVLVENFTWDWIYRGYAKAATGIDRHAPYFKKLNGQATRHIQTQPLCRIEKRSLCVGPIARRPRTKRAEIRNRLGIPDDFKMVLVSMGGVPDRFEFIAHLPTDLKVYLVIPGSHNQKSSHDRVIFLNARSAFYHPDLVAACDALVGKMGYSTLAEAYFAGVPFGFISRSDFPESAILEQFLRRRMSSLCISPQSYSSGQWIKSLPELLALPRTKPKLENGATATACAITKLLI